MKTLNKTLTLLVTLGALTFANATSGAEIYTKCVACHGANAEKKAMGKSQIIAGWEKTKTVAALQGYKDGSYGGPMKGVMKGQVMRLSEAEIEAVAEYIATKK